MTAIRARLALIAIVCACVFYTSFRHITHVALSYGNTADVAVLYPICIDAVILVSALTLTARTGVNRVTKLWASAGRYFGFAATIFCNVSSSEFASSMAVVVALIPAIALIITVELLIHAAQGTPATRARKAKKATVTQLRSAS
jgi:drug/metabolite transporter (DMT)-like permease